MVDFLNEKGLSKQGLFFLVGFVKISTGSVHSWILI